MIVQELIAVLGFRVNPGQVSQANAALDSMGSKMAGIAAAALAVGAAIGAVANAVQNAAKLETMNAEFEVMLKNADAAKYLVQEINRFAAETPFETEGLTRNVRLFMSFGQSALQSVKYLKMIGDIAGSSQEKLNRLGLAYAQAAGKGKLTGEEQLQFVEAGFNPLKTISEITGKSMMQLEKGMSKGAISFAMVQKAIEKVTGPGGLFFENSAKQAKTLDGLWSTLKDNFKMMSAELGTELLPYLKAVLTALIELTPAIGDAFRQLTAFFGVFAKDGPTAQDTANGIATSFMTIADAIMTITTAGQGMWGVLQVIFGAMMLYSSGIARVWAFLPWIIAKGMSFAQEKLATLYNWLGDKEGAARMRQNSMDAQEGADLLQTPGRFLQDMGLESFGAAGKSFSKFATMGSMIGGSKGAAPGSQVKMTDDILKALTNSGKTVNNNITNNVNVNAEGTFKDIMKEASNAAFSLTVLQTRLVGASM